MQLYIPSLTRPNESKPLFKQLFFPELVSGSISKISKDPEINSG